MGGLNRGAQRQGQVDLKTCELDGLLRRPSLGINRGRLAWSERDSQGKPPGRLGRVGRRFPLRRRGSSEKRRQAAPRANEDRRALKPTDAQLVAETARDKGPGARVCAAHGRETTLEYQYSPLLHA